MAARALPPLIVGRTLYSRAVLFDTGAFLAIANRSDGNHRAAVECLAEIAERRLPVFVTIPTIYEAHRRFLFDAGAASARAFLERVFDGSLNLIWTAEPDESEARRLIIRYEDLHLTLTDMAVMTRLQIAACFSFDVHFLQAGFIRIPPFHLDKV